MDVLPRKLSQMEWRQVEPILNALLNKAEFVPIRYSWRPSVPDPDDDRVVDCVMNAGAMLVTHNARDFVRASHTLGFEVVSAIDFVTRLAGKADE
jgi:predicted nucleic acid-binding protein